MFFKRIQKILDKLWVNERKYYSGALILTDILLFLSVFSMICPTIDFSGGHLIDFNFYIALTVGMLTFLALAAGFIGSQSIQYSLTKILSRYRYIETFLVTILLLIAGDYANSLNFWGEGAMIVLIIVLIIQTLIIVDRVFDPENLIVEVIVPMILQYENSSIDQYIKNNDPVGSKVYRDAISQMEIKFFQYQIAGDIFNAELEAYSKAIFRLSETNSLRISYLFQLIRMQMLKRNEELQIHDYYSEHDQLELQGGFLWSLLIYAAYQIVILNRTSSQADISHQNMAAHILLLAFTRKSRKELGMNDRHVDMIGIMPILEELRDKTSIITILYNFIENVEVKDKALISDVDKYIVDIIGTFLVSFIRKNYRHLVNKTRLSDHEERNFGELLRVANKIMKQSIYLKPDGYAIPDSFLNSYFELWFFDECIDNLLEKSRWNISTIDYFEIAFGQKKCIEKMEKKIGQGRNGIIPNISLKYYEIYKQKIKGLNLVKGMFSEDVMKGQLRIKEAVKNRDELDANLQQVKK